MIQIRHKHKLTRGSAPQLSFQSRRFRCLLTRNSKIFFNFRLDVGNAIPYSLEVMPWLLGSLTFVLVALLLRRILHMDAVKKAEGGA